MFLTLNQALAISPVGMAMTMGPRPNLIKRHGDGVLAYGQMIDGMRGNRLSAEDLDRCNRRFVLRNINCRPVYL